MSRSRKNRRSRRQNDDICFLYERYFGLEHAPAMPILQDLMNKFMHIQGTFVEDDPHGRTTAYKLGQQSVINHMLAQINQARKKAGENNV